MTLLSWLNLFFFLFKKSWSPPIYSSNLVKIWSLNHFHKNHKWFSKFKCNGCNGDCASATHTCPSEVLGMLLATSLGVSPLWITLAQRERGALLKAAPPSWWAGCIQWLVDAQVQWPSPLTPVGEGAKQPSQSGGVQQGWLRPVVAASQPNLLL